MEGNEITASSKQASSFRNVGNRTITPYIHRPH